MLRNWAEMVICVCFHVYIYIYTHIYIYIYIYTHKVFCEVLILPVLRHVSDVIWGKNFSNKWFLCISNNYRVLVEFLLVSRCEQSLAYLCPCILVASGVNCVLLLFLVLTWHSYIRKEVIGNRGSHFLKTEIMNEMFVICVWIKPIFIVT